MCFGPLKYSKHFCCSSPFFCSNVLKLLKFWLENYPADFFNPIDNLAKVEVFAGSCEAHESIALKETIANVKADVNRHSQAAWIDRILHTGTKFQ